MTDLRVKLAAYSLAVLVLLAAGFAAAWFWQANAYGKVIATNEASRQADLAPIANAGADQARKALEKQQEAAARAAASDEKYTKKKPMISSKTKLCAALLLTALAGCASREVVVPVAGTCPKPPAPPAWVMQPPSNSLQQLDALFLISEPASLPTKQP